MTRYIGEIEYSIDWRTPANVTIEYIKDAGPFQYTKAINSEGDFSLLLPPYFDFRRITKDQIIRISRRPPGGVLAVDFVGLIRDWDIAQTAGGYQYVIAGPGIGWILGGRSIAYDAGHAQAEMTDQADDMARQIVRYNLGSSATVANGREAAGNISTALFSVQADTASGPSLSFAFSHQNVLDTIRKIETAAQAAGNPIYWEIVPSGSAYEFRVSVDQLGADRSTGANKLIFGPEFGNFTNGRLEFRSRDERNYAFALGQGDGTARNVQVSEDTDRSDLSPWSLRETSVEDANLTTDAQLLDLADSAVFDGRPLWRLTGDLVSTERTQYQRDWKLGDAVMVSFAGRQGPALIRSVTVSVNDRGQETIQGGIEITG